MPNFARPGVFLSQEIASYENRNLISQSRHTRLIQNGRCAPLPSAVSDGWKGHRHSLVSKVSFGKNGIIAPFRAPKSAAVYKKVWLPEGSPLKVYGLSLAEKVQKLMGPDYMVRLGMRYRIHPWKA